MLDVNFRSRLHRTCHFQKSIAPMVRSRLHYWGSLCYRGLMNWRRRTS